ncbi:molybdopterin molybdotransferase MoeA [soil metagenome]
MIEFAEAQASLLRLARKVGHERVALAQADRRVLADDVRAPGDLPPFDYSTMDGYAVAHADVIAESAMPVIEESRTGLMPSPLAPKSAMRIFTGAPLPIGADAVIPQEEATRAGDDIRFTKAPKYGAFLRRRGDDRKAGDVVLRGGVVLGPAHLALLASVDSPDVAVAKLPRVTVLTTGDELRDPGSPNVAGTIPDSNGVSLAAFFARALADVTLAPRVRDDAAATRAAIEAALFTSDVLVVVGGMSVGDHDVVRAALGAAGVDIAFWRVAIKPGKPLAVGTHPSGAMIVGLPGNPASALVTGALFVIPLLRAMQGALQPFPSPLRVPLARDFERDPGRLEFLRATLREGDGTVDPLTHQASGAAWNVANATCLAVMPKELAHIAQGTLVDVHLFAELGL